MPRVDIAPAAYKATSSPGVIHQGTGPSTVVAVLDARGTWGNGYEAAAWMREALLARWANEPPTAEAIAEHMVAAAQSIPEHLDDDYFGCAFCGLALVVERNSFIIVAAGGIECCKVTGRGLEHVYRTRLLIDDFVASAKVDPAEVPADSPLRSVASGPFFGRGDKQQPVRLGPFEIDDGQILAIAHRSLFNLLRVEDPEWLATASAAQWQQRDSVHSPVVLVHM